MKKILSLFLAFLITLSLCACGGAEELTEGYLDLLAQLKAE